MAYTEFRFESKTPTGGKKMFTVGEFSRICQVSIKTLHHYDRIGLLAPLKVDPFSGYRYYGQQQVEKMLLIGRMKRYGFSLKIFGCFSNAEITEYSFLSCASKKRN